MAIQINDSAGTVLTNCCTFSVNACHRVLPPECCFQAAGLLVDGQRPPHPRFGCKIAGCGASEKEPKFIGEETQPQVVRLLVLPVGEGGRVAGRQVELRLELLNLTN